MSMKFRRSLCGAVAAIISIVFPDLIQAAEYPERPVKIVAANPPGGLTDIIARIVAEGLQRQMGKPFVVENHPGASSTVGYGFVNRTAADGYTLLLNTESQTLMPAFFPDLSFNPIEDFEPISIIVEVPMTIAVSPKLPANTLEELIALGKSSGGELNFASGGIGTANHVAGLQFMTAAGIKMVHVPYQGSGPALADLVAGHVDVFVPTTSSIASYYSGGSVKVLVVAGDKRSPLLPNVPSAVEAGLPAFKYKTWAGLAAPKGTPPEIISLLNEKVMAMLADPATHERLAALGTPLGTTPAAAKERIINEGKANLEMIKSLDVK